MAQYEDHPTADQEKWLEKKFITLKFKELISTKFLIGQ